MGLYDTGKRKLVGIRLTQYQQDKLNRVCSTFGISHQRLFSDFVDYFAVQYLNVVSGTESINSATKESAQRLFDDMVDLKGLRGEVKKTYSQRLG